MSDEGLKQLIQINVRKIQGMLDRMAEDRLERDERNRQFDEFIQRLDQAILRMDKVISRITILNERLGTHNYGDN